MSISFALVLFFIVPLHVNHTSVSVHLGSLVLSRKYHWRNKYVLISFLLFQLPLCSCVSQCSYYSYSAQHAYYANRLCSCSYSSDKMTMGGSTASLLVVAAISTDYHNCKYCGCCCQSSFLLLLLYCRLCCRRRCCCHCWCCSLSCYCCCWWWCHAMFLQ